MKIGLIVLLLAVWVDPLHIRKVNQAKEAAESAYKKGDYPAAIERYQYLIDSLQVSDDAIRLNLAHAHYLMKDTTKARTGYESLTESGNTVVQSKALQQLGVMANQSGHPVEALELFKRAIKADSRNMDARYNYEMLKKKLENKNKNQQQQQNQDKNQQQNQDSQEPSEFARRLKEQADRLVAQHRYKEAHALMLEGLKKDATVGTYQEYIKRIGEVVEINP